MRASYPSDLSASSGAGQYTVAESDGALAFVPATGEQRGTTMLEVDRTGHELRSFATPRQIGPFSIPPAPKRETTS